MFRCDGKFGFWRVFGHQNTPHVTRTGGSYRSSAWAGLLVDPRRVRACQRLPPRSPAGRQTQAAQQQGGLTARRSGGPARHEAAGRRHEASACPPTSQSFFLTFLIIFYRISMPKFFFYRNCPLAPWTVAPPGAVTHGARNQI